MRTSKVVRSLGAIFIITSCAANEPQPPSSAPIALPSGWCSFDVVSSGDQCNNDGGLAYKCRNARGEMRQLLTRTVGSPACKGAFSKEVRFQDGTAHDQILHGIEIVSQVTPAEVSRLRQSDGSELPSEARDFIDRARYIVIAVRADSDEVSVSYVMHDSAVVVSDGEKGMTADYTIF